MINIKDLHKSYKMGSSSLHVLKGINFNIEEGELVAIMGSSGSGKSTLLNILGMLDVADEGDYILDNVPIKNLNETKAAKYRNKFLGFVFQSFNLIPTLTSEENKTLPSSIAGKKPEEEWVKQVIEAMDIGDRLGHRPNELSGGQQQRVAAARAMASKPEVIFADEPSGNLDSKSSKELLVFMKSIVDDLNQTIVMVTHDPYAASFAERVIMLKDGEIANDLDNPTQEEIVSQVTSLTEI